VGRRSRRVRPPSVLCGGTNPLYGKTLGYLTEAPEEPMVFFHLWNGTAAARRPDDARYEQDLSDTP
jgi:hypothetical protein